MGRSFVVRACFQAHPNIIHSASFHSSLKRQVAYYMELFTPRAQETPGVAVQSRQAVCLPPLTKMLLLLALAKDAKKRKSCVRTILVATDQSQLPDIIDYLLPTSPLHYEGYALFLRIMCLVLQHLQVALTCLSGHYCVPLNGINVYWPTKPIRECESTLLEMLVI